MLNRAYPNKTSIGVQCNSSELTHTAHGKEPEAGQALKFDWIQEAARYANNPNRLALTV